MNSYFFKSGNAVSIKPADSCEVLRSLPAATYTVKKNDMTGEMYLQVTSDFDLPPKMYGTGPESRSNRIINTFNSRTKSTGILLSGDKGSGKTLLSKFVAAKLIESGVPVIVINEPWCGPAFNDLIGNIKQPAMVIFDEFDKVYDCDDQKLLLTLLDGTVETKKLFVLTTNEGHVDEHMINRPGRIFYHYHYDGLDEDFVRSYATDVLQDKTQMEDLVAVTSAFSSMTFDMLQAMIEDMNRYNETARQVLDCLNVDITAENTSYTIRLFYGDAPVNNNFYPFSIDYNPMFTKRATEIELYFDDQRTLKNEADDDSFPELLLSQANFERVSKGGVITYKVMHKDIPVRIVVEKQRRGSFNWDAF